MSFQNSLEALIGAFIAFYIGCFSIGRPDIPLVVSIHILSFAA